MRRTIAILLLLAVSLPASTLSFSGALDPNNANDVALISLNLAVPAGLAVQTYGYGGTANAPGGTNAAGQVIAPGGFDPYLSLFNGTGSGATFLVSNDDGVCPPGLAAPACADATLNIAGLAAGQYTLAITVFENMPVAENRGSGVLGDGFIGLAIITMPPAIQCVRPIGASIFRVPAWLQSLRQLFKYSWVR